MNSQRVLAGRYRLVDRLGAGGMSVVWRAHDLVLDRDVAVKLLASTDDPALRESIRFEALTVARLTHPHVTSVFDYGEAEGEGDERVPFVVMELLRGTSLADLTAPLSPREALRVGAQVAGALAAAHARGVVHRDVKPGNVMITAGGAKVFDFGIAAPVGSADGAGPEARILGTPAFLAPERLTGSAVSAASDVYALGVLLYRMLTHELPWPARTSTEIMIAHVHIQPAALPEIAGVPATVRDLYRRCLAKDPAERPTAREIATTLAEAAAIPAPLSEPAGVDAGAPFAIRDWRDRYTEIATAPMPLEPVLVAAPADRPRRRRLALLAATVVVGLALAVGIGVAASSNPLGTPELSAAGIGPMIEPPADPPLTAVGTAPEGKTGEVVTVHDDPAPPAKRPPPKSDPRVVVRAATFVSLGGTVTAECTGDKARIVSWTPARGYRVKDAPEGPESHATITFRSLDGDIVITITCKKGLPVAEIRLKSSL